MGEKEALTKIFARSIKIAEKGKLLSNRWHCLFSFNVERSMFNVGRSSFFLALPKILQIFTAS